jgi:hypothetical protein
MPFQGIQNNIDFQPGMGVGSLSMIVPMYVAECAPPELRGLLIGMQQFAIEFGIMVSFWIVSNIPWVVKVAVANGHRTMEPIILVEQAKVNLMRHGSYLSPSNLLLP